jgi:hypothetical protein
MTSVTYAQVVLGCETAISPGCTVRYGDVYIFGNDHPVVGGVRIASIPYRIMSKMELD